MDTTFHIDGVETTTSLDTLDYAVREWGKARKITVNGTVEAQLLKTVEELGELASDIARQRCINDSLGDVLVTLIMVAELQGTSLTEALLHAYNEIKDRKGYLSSSGVFIKEEN